MGTPARSGTRPGSVSTLSKQGAGPRHPPCVRDRGSELSSSYQTMVYKGHVATVCDATYDAWVAEVATVPPRKRKNWSAALLDSYGTRVSVRYAPQEVGLGLQTLFEERLTGRGAADRGLPEGSWIPVQSISIKVEKAARCRTEGAVFLSRTPDGRFEEPVMDNATLEARASAETQAHHTGNHRPHRHTVRVPTRAGEPVRG